MRSITRTQVRDTSISAARVDSTGRTPPRRRPHEHVLARRSPWQLAHEACSALLDQVAVGMKERRPRNAGRPARGPPSNMLVLDKRAEVLLTVAATASGRTIPGDACAAPSWNAPPARHGAIVPRSTARLGWTRQRSRSSKVASRRRTRLPRPPRFPTSRPCRPLAVAGHRDTRSGRGGARADPLPHCGGPPRCRSRERKTTAFAA